MKRPPIISFTTSDFAAIQRDPNQLADLIAQLKRTESLVLLHQWHLVEWLALAEDALDARLEVVGQLPHVAFLQIPKILWRSDTVSLMRIDGVGLRALFGELRPHLEQKRDSTLKVVEYKFFARIAELSPDIAIQTAQKLDHKYGMSLTKKTRRIQTLGQFAEQVFKPFMNLMPTSRKRLLKHSRKQIERLEEFRPDALSEVYGISPNHPSLCLRIAVQRALENRPDKLDGLSELVDLNELGTFFQVDFFSADKHMRALIKQVVDKQPEWLVGYNVPILLAAGRIDKTIQVLDSVSDGVSNSE